MLSRDDYTHPLLNYGLRQLLATAILTYKNTLRCQSPLFPSRNLKLNGYGFFNNLMDGDLVTILDKEKLTKISRDLGQLLPFMKNESKDCFSRRVGPLIVSVWYDAPENCENYRLNASVYNLAREGASPIPCLTLNPKNNLTAISWDQHEQGAMVKGINNLKKTYPIPLEAGVYLAQVVSAYQWYIAKRVGWNFNLKELEDIALISGWSGRLEVATDMLNWARPIYERRYKEMVKHNQRVEDTPFEYRADLLTYDLSQHDIPQWYDSMHTMIRDQDKLRYLVNEGVEKFNLQYLPYTILDRKPR